MKNLLKTLPIIIKNGRIALNFKLSDVKAMAIVGVDLVALMQDGTRLLLPGLALKILERPSPELQFEDQQLSGAELFTKVDIDSTTLKDADEALQVPVSEPTANDGQNIPDEAQTAATDSASQAAAKEGDKGAEQPPAWYQQYGWIFGIVGLVGLALGLSGGKKGGGKEEDKPADKPADTGEKPGSPDSVTPSDGNTGEKPVVHVTGSLAAGVFNHAQTLSVTLYDSQGQRLGKGELVVGPHGQVQSYRADLPDDYVGFVRVVVSDGMRDGLGFIDEFRQAMALTQGMTQTQADQLASTDFPALNAIGYRSAGQSELVVSVTPLTELVARLLGVPTDPTQPLDGALSVEQVNAMAAAVAKFATQFTSDAELLDVLGPVVAINAENFAAASGDAQTYGKVLAGLTGLDAASGALENTLHLLTAGLAADTDGTLRVAPTVEGAILLAAMQQANTLLGKLVDSSLFETFKLPEAPWGSVAASFTDATEPVSPTLDLVGQNTRPSMTVSWTASPDHIAAGQVLALYLLNGQKIASHALTQADVDAGSLVLRADDYGTQTLGEDGVKRLFAGIVSETGELVARSELRTYGLVSVEVNGITGLSSDTGISPSDFITNQPVQAVSGTYLGTLGSNTHIEVSADGGKTWAAAQATPALEGPAGGTWVSDSLRLDGAAASEASKLLTRVTVSGVNGEQPLTLPGASHDFVLDVSPPDAAVASIDSISAPFVGAVLPGGFLFSQASQTVHGTVQGHLTDDDRIMVSIDGGASWIAGEFSEDGKAWNVAVAFSKYGSGEILAHINDVAGNATAAMARPYQFSAPTLIGVQPTQAVRIVTVTDDAGDPSDPYDFIGALSPDMSTDDRRPTLSGTLSAALEGDQVLVLATRINGGAEQLLGYANVAPPAQADQLPNWSFTPVSDMALGSHHIVVKVFSPGANAFAPAYPEGMDAETPGAQSNWGSWDMNVQSISFDGVIIPGVTSINLLTSPNRVTDNAHPILTGTLGSLLAPGEYVALYDAVNGREPKLVGKADITPADNGAGATWRYTFQDGIQLGDGEHLLRVVIEHPDRDGTSSPLSLLSAAAPSVIVSTELPDQQVIIDQVLDDVGIYMGVVASDASTDDTAPTLSGTLSAPLRPGQSLQVRAEDAGHPDKVFTYTPVIDETGLAWSLSINPELPVGNYSLTAGVVNAGGAMGALNSSFNLRINSLTFSHLDDAADPITGNVFAGAEPFLTDDKTPILRGQLGTLLGKNEALQIVSAQAGKNTVLGLADITPSEQGGFSWQLTLNTAQDTPTQLPDGESTLSARVIDTLSGEVRLAVDRVIHVDNGTPTERANISEVRDQFIGNNGFVGPLASGQSTDDRQPLISGSLEGARTLPSSRAVQIIDKLTQPNGKVTESVLGLATVRDDGGWNFTPGNSLELGDHTFSARVINQANGQTGPAGQSLTIRENRVTFNTVRDNVGPLQGNLLDSKLFAQPPYTDDTRPQLSGQLDMPLGPNERISIYDSESGGPAMRLGTAVVTGSSWTFSPSGSLRNGAHQFQVRVERIQGGENAQVLLSDSTLAITIDGTSPPITQSLLTLTVTDNNATAGSRTGPVTFRASTDDVRPVVSGTLSEALTAGQQVQVFASINDRTEHKLGAATLNGLKWSFALKDALPYGPTTLLARIVALNSGLKSNTLFTTINVNSITLSEITEITTGVNVLTRKSHGTGDNNVTLHGNIAAPLLLSGERVGVYAKAAGESSFIPIGVAKVTNNTDWHFSLPSRNGLPQVWQEGGYEVLVRIEDATERTSRAVAQTTFTVDTQAPGQHALITGYQDQVGELQALITQTGTSTDDVRGIVRGTLDQEIDSHTRGVVLYDLIDGHLVRLGEATVTGTTWTFQYLENFVPGVHHLTARVENFVANKTGESSPDFSIHVQQVFLDSIVDPTHPEQNILTPAIDGASAQGLLTFNGRLSAALAPDEELRISINGAIQAHSATLTKDGLGWSYALPEEDKLTDGAYTIAAQVVSHGDSPETRVVSVPHSVYIDGGMPTETVTISKARDTRAAGPSFSGDNASDVSSDDPLPLLKGTVSAILPGGRSVAIYGQMPGQDTPAFLGYASVTADAAWTFQIDRELPFGDTLFTARVVNRTDPATLHGDTSAVFIVREQALSITALIDDRGAVNGDLFHFQSTAPAGELRTNDLRPTLTGRLAAPLKNSETISIFYGDTKLGLAVIAGDGVSWSFTPMADVTPGTRRFSAVLLAADGTSLISAQTPAVTLSTLQAGHTVNITNINDSNNVSGTLNETPPKAQAPIINVLSRGILDDARPFLSGTLTQALNASEVLQVYATDNSGVRRLLGTATTSAKTWSLQLEVSLPAGMSQLQAAIENRADGSDAVLSAPISVNMVSLSPVSLDDMSVLNAVASPRPTLRASVNTDSPQNLTVQVQVDGALAGTADVGADGVWSFAFPSDLAPGMHRVEYSLLHSGSPIASVLNSAPTLFTVSGTDAPSFSVTMTQADTPIVTDHDLTMLTGTTSTSVAAGMGVMVSIDGQDVGLAGLDASRQHWSYELWAPSPGAHVVTVRPINLATLATLEHGNASTTVYQNQITIENPSHAITLRDGALALLNSDDSVTLSGKLASPLPRDSTLQVQRDGVVLGTATIMDGTKWSYTLTAPNQTLGAHQYRVVALPPSADTAAADMTSELSAQATLNFMTADSGPSASLFTWITGLANNSSTSLLNANATLTDPLPILRGAINTALAPQDQIAVFGKSSPAGEQIRLGVARMLTDTTWEFRVNQPLPRGNYTLTAVPENRLTHIVNDFANATANLQIQLVTIQEVTDTSGVIQGNVLDNAAHVTDDGTPDILVTLSAPLRTSEQYLIASDTVNGKTIELERTQIKNSDDSFTSWRFKPSTPLADGKHTLSVAVVTANTSKVEAEHSVSFIKDSSTPTQTVLIKQVRDDDGSTIGNVPINGAIDYPRPQVSGTLSAKLSNAQVLRIWQDTGDGKAAYLGDATVNGTNWSWRSDKDMAFGSINLFATVDNAAKVGLDYPAPEGSAHGVPSPTYRFRLQALDAIQVKNDLDENVAASTSERQFTISGTLATPLVSGEYVEIRDGDRVLGRAQVDELAWHFHTGEQLGNGLHNFKISIAGGGNNPETPLVFAFLPVNVHEAASDPLQAGLIEAVIALPETQSLSAGSAFDTLAGQSVRPGQSLGDSRVGIFGTLALAPRGGDLVQVFDNDVLLGAATVAGTRWWYTADGPLTAGAHEFTLRINEQAVPVSDSIHAAAYPVQVLDSDAIRIDDLTSRTDIAQSLSGSLHFALGVGEALGVYRTLNGKTMRLGDARVADSATDGRFAWQFSPDPSLTLGVGAQTLTVQVEGATHTRIAAAQSTNILIDEAAIATAATLLSVSTPQSNGLASLVPGASVANPALIVSGTLDRDLIGSERVALYDDTALVGYATVGANGRNWTYTSTGLPNGHHQLNARVENKADIAGPRSPAFALDIIARTPGQTVTPIDVRDSAPLGSAAAQNTQGFSVFVWNMPAAHQPDIRNIWTSSSMSPTGQTQEPQIDHGAFSASIFPNIPYSVVANYVGSGWFHVSPEQSGIWSFRSPKVDDFEILSIDGQRVAVQPTYSRDGLQGSISLDAGWHYLRADTGNTAGPGYWTVQWRRPGESDFSVIRDIQTGPTEKAVALGATDQKHDLTLDYALSAPLKSGETLQVMDLTAHRTADGLRLQFWNLPQDPNRSFQEALALASEITPVVSRMTDSLRYDYRNAYDDNVTPNAFSMMGRATGWFHVTQDEVGTWLFRGTTRFDHVQLKIDGHTLMLPDLETPHAQYASMHLEAGWHYLDSTLFQGDNRAEDWDISVIKPWGKSFEKLTGFAQFESGVLGQAVVHSDDDHAASFHTTVNDGNSHTLSAAVVDKAHGSVSDPMENGGAGMVFLANGAFGIVDKKLDVIGDGQLISLPYRHSTINVIDLDADKAAHPHGNTLVMEAAALRQADIGSAALLHSDLLDPTAHQLVVLGGDSDVLRFGAMPYTSAWQEKGRIDGADDSHFTVFSHTSEKLQVIVDTHVHLDLDGALRSNAHPVI